MSETENTISVASSYYSGSDATIVAGSGVITIKQDKEMIKTFMVYFECNNGYDSRDDIVDMLMQ